ncbi:MAG: hypothetical protein QOF43_1399, partial [Gaiellaceae bacterium]|nr:hypothetical protein [Gaiellaceae bacterium]
VGHLIDLACKRVHLRPLARPFLTALNVLGPALDARVPLLREAVPGSLIANFHVEAVA